MHNISCDANNSVKILNATNHLISSATTIFLKRVASCKKHSPSRNKTGFPVVLMFPFLFLTVQYSSSERIHILPATVL